MQRIEWSTPRVHGFGPNLRERLLAKVGPPRLTALRCAGASVVAAPGRYCVSYIIEGARSLVLVDVGSTQDVPRLARVARFLGKPVGLVVATHLHFDHILGLDRAARHFKAPIALGQVGHAHVAAQRPLRPLIRMGMPHFWRTWIWQGMPPFYRKDMPRGLGYGFPWSRNRFRASLAAPLEDGAALPHAEDWQVLLTPGHSDDAICLFHKACGILVAGDTVRNFLGGEWNPLLTDRGRYAESIARLRALSVQAVLPGHGPVIEGPDCIQSLRPLPTP